MNPDLGFNLQILVNGILAGGVLALVAVGFSLVWGIMNIINLAHGTFIMLGAYLAYVLFTNLHIDPFLSIPITFGVLFVFGYLVQRYVINFVVRAPILTTFLLTFGLSLLLINLVLFFFHGDIKGITTAYSGSSFHLGPVVVPWTKFWTLIVALVLTAVLQAFLTRTKLGRAIRATSLDINAAQLSGVRVAHIYALVGGLAYGIIESFGSQYVGTGVQDAVALVVLLLVLAFRPQGILGKAQG